MSAPINLLFFIPSFGGGGAERQCAYLANALALREDFSVSLAYFREGVNFPLVDDTRVKLLKIHSVSNFDPRNASNLRVLIKQQRPDIVFSWLHAADVYTWGARMLGARFKWLMAERDSWYPPDFRYWLRDRAGVHADLIASNSTKGDAYWSARGVPSSRRTIVENALPDAWFVQSPRAEVARPLVCYAGRLEPQKNVLRLLHAFRHASRARRDADFCIIGDGSLGSQLAAQVKLDQPERITLKPFQDDIRAVFCRASVFVNISNHEGRPNTVIENMALGNRVVLSRIPEHLDLVGQDYPFLVDPAADPAVIAETLELAIASPVSPAEQLLFRTRLEPMRLAAVADSYASILRGMV